MEIIKKYTAVKLSTKRIDDDVIVELGYGKIKGPYYSLDYPEEEFFTEEDAYTYAYKTDKYAKWLIVPIIKFD